MKSNVIIPAIVAASALLVGSAAAQSTPQGQKAWGDRLQGEAREYQALRANIAVSPPRSFAWGDAAIGASVGFALALVAAAGFALRRYTGREATQT